MGLQVISRQLIARAVTANSDVIVAYVPLPTGSKLNNVWLDVSIGGSVLTCATACMYGVSGFVTGVDDPAEPYGYDDLWDRYIQKDRLFTHAMMDSSTGPFETGTVDYDPEFEVGQVDLEAIFGSEILGNTEIFARRELISFPKRPVGFHTSSDLSVQYYMPVDAFKTHIRGGPRAVEPSVAMFGFSSPAMDQTQNALETTPTEREWVMLQYAQVFLYDAWKYLMGLSASTGEYPDAQASDWLAEILENAMIETTGYVAPNGYAVVAKVTWDITVPGEPEAMTLTSE